MSLKNFFTESELKEGLTIHDRVNELITVMQKEKDSLVNNFGQWSTVANTIAVTENNNCLDLFVQLDGLFFIDKWLKYAQKLKNDNEDEFPEEIIISLLKALERLKIDNFSEIGKTVQNLVAYSCIEVSEKAKELCDNWMLIQDNNVVPRDVKSLEALSSEKVEIETKNQEALDPVDKSTDDDGNILVKFEVLNSKSEEILEMSTLSADVENTLESFIKTDVLSDKDDAVLDNNESPKMSSNSESDTEAENLNGGVQSKENTENGSEVYKLSINNDKSDMELDYGMIDPLDIARQVANEVEQDVDSREQSCSTSDSKSGQEILNQSQLVKEAEPELVKESAAPVSQVSEVAQESELDTGRVFSGFDLNQEVCSEEVDNSVNQVNPINSVTSTISVVSASPAAFPAQLHASPLQFNGTHKNTKQRLDFLDFDLNVTEDGEEDKMVILPVLHSGEESSVANPSKPEMVQLLDLNSIGDENVVNQNRWQSPYLSSSSSSSSKQPVLKKNIDLNLTDQPFFPTSEDSVISIFGTKVEVKKNDYVPKLDFNYGNPNPLFYGSSSHATHMPMPMSYMVDSHGLSFVPLSSSVGQPQHNFDLNNGLMLDNGGFRQFFSQNRNEEASSSSSVLGKRREPDLSWEFFPVNKHQQPPWR